MSKQFRLPDLGEGVTEGQIVRVLVAEGDRVAEDQPLMEVETDKASVEIPSPFSGIVEKVHVSAQQVVNVGDVMVTFSGAADDAREFEVKHVKAGGAAGRTAATTATTGAPARHTPASPAVRKLARELGVNLDALKGSGPGGRVTREDVEAAASGPATSAKAPAAREAARPRPDAADAWGPVTREPLTRARKAIAEAMAHSASSIPHATDTDDADVTELDRLRHGDAGKRKLSILPFVIKATALALAEHPIFNASYDADHEQIVHYNYISIAVAVHTERGLIAPVLRNADRLSLAQIADELAVLAEKARTVSFEVNDTRGGTFTISNAGAVGGSRYSIPIINPPQAAILALGRTRLQPWVVDGRIVPRLILPLSLSFDHRLIDGAQEILFMQSIIRRLETPAVLLQ